MQKGNQLKLKKRYYGKDKAGVDAESRAEIAAKAFVEHLKNKSQQLEIHLNMMVLNCILDKQYIQRSNKKRISGKY